MWRFVILVTFAVPWTSGQNPRTSAHQDHGGHGWDIRLAVPGEPGSDYPTLGAIPRTSFSCAGKTPGYYADLETNCQVFRVCTVGSTYGFQSFLCPNGTLFNQAVFVCDWWMNVNCQTSQQLFSNNNEKFGNLRLGPQLMKDIKKMLTHPMRNPYDKNAMKSNLIVMQDYRPPFGQLFPNEALLAGPERSPNNIYVPAKQVQITNQNTFNGNDIAFAASTPDPRYLPAAFNTIQQSTSRDTEVFQRQRQNGQYMQTNRIQSSQIRQHGNNPSNTNSGQVTQTNLNANLQFSGPTQTPNNGNIQYGQKQISNTRPTKLIQNTANSQRGQHINQQFSHYTNSPSPARLVNGKQSEVSVSYSKQQYNGKQEKQPYTYKQPQIQFSSDINGKAGNEAKQNLVSADLQTVPSTVITKTLTLKRIIQDPKRGHPKSRITVKTWIVKPSKSGKLINPNAYTYDKPTQPSNQKLINSAPYVYNKPTQPSSQKLVNPTPYTYDKPTQPPTEKLIETTPYVYNRPTTAEAEKIINESEEPYIYNKPTTVKLINLPSKEPVRKLPTSTTTRPTLSRLYLSPTSPPTQASRLYLPPTTYNPSSRLYLPPVEDPVILSRQYLAPADIQETTRYQSEPLRATPTTPSPNYLLPNADRSFSRLQQSPMNRKNLTFTDILTKEKLDLTVDDIVKDTSRYLNTASPDQFEQLRGINSVDYPEETYLPPDTKIESGESLTSQTPTSTTIPKSSRLVSSPSTDLEPPIETFNSNENTKTNANQIANLPFYKESFTPTIERTVSLKISIPEKVASYLFKKHNESDFDRLEILNTGSSNYLVLTNNYVNKNSYGNFIPIGKLVSDKQSNISNSQALVFSLLADSINVAKDYNNAQQDTIKSAPLQSQFQNINDKELSHITNQISQLTSSQYSSNHQKGYQNANTVSATASTPNNNGYQNYGYFRNEYSQKQVQQPQTTQYSSSSLNTANENQSQLSRYRSGSNTNAQTNSKQVYSGQLYQLPVPDVTQQIFNENIGSNNDAKSPDSEVEIIKSESIPIEPPARLEASPESEHNNFNSEENFNKFVSSNTGISAQLNDKIVGTLPHPIENNKLVTYKKDESYYVYTKLDHTFGNNNVNSIESTNAARPQSARLIQGNNLPNVVAFQFIPSVSYQLEDEKEQQKLLNAFNIDEYGNPKQKGNLIDTSNQPILTTNVDYSIDHTLPTKQIFRQGNNTDNLYTGPSSYSAPQASVGRLISKQNSKLELEDNTNGYVKIIPSRQFIF